MSIEQTRRLTDQFTEQEGRRPRLLLVALGASEDERSLRLYAAAYADSGFDVDVAPLRQKPADAARMAAENDVHIIGILGLQQEEETQLQQLLQELYAQERSDIPHFTRSPHNTASTSPQALHSFSTNATDYHSEAETIIQKLYKHYELS